MTAPSRPVSRATVFAVGAAVACAALFVYTQHLIYTAPMLDVLYFNQKIFYYHVPSAFMLFAAVFTCGISSLLFLRARKPGYDVVAEAAGELSVLFGAIVLVTGSIWGKAAWNHWWEWDARLTSSLLLEMLMIAYLLVRKYGGPSADRLSAGVAVFAMVDVPLIYFSVNIWRTIHPKTSVVPGLAGQQRVAFWLSVSLFAMFFGLLLATRVAYGRARRRLVEVRERALDAGIIE
jgi:heme exporter protein C